MHTKLKIFSVTILANTAAILFAVPATAELWYKVTENASNNDVFLVDIDSIGGVKEFRYYWQRRDISVPTIIQGTSIKGVLTYKSVDCNKQMERIRKVEEIGEEGKVILRKYDDDAGELRPVDPDSDEGKVMTFVCSRHPTK